jgi:hypothetical protein
MIVLLVTDEETPLTRSQALPGNAFAEAPPRIKEQRCDVLNAGRSVGIRKKLQKTFPMFNLPVRVSHSFDSVFC